MQDLYLRFTSDIDKDLDNGSSVHFTGLDEGDRGIKENEIVIDGQICEKIDGHCVFDLENLIEDESIESIEELVAFIKEEGFYETEAYNTGNFESNWVIVKGKYIGECPEGCTITIQEIIYEAYK